MCCGDDEKPEPKNNFDQNGHFDANDPFHGAPHHFDYVEMSVPKPKKGQAYNQSWYWMWECVDTQNQDAPVLVSLIGGPGMAIASKMFGYFNPVDICPDTHTVIRNPNSITDRCNLLYLDCPVGAGLSVCSKGNEVRTFDDIGANAQETIEDVLRVYPHLRKVNWYFTGESFGGLSVPLVASTACLGPLALPLGGVSIYCPVINFDCLNEYDRRIEIYKKHGHMQNCCTDCCCTCVLSCGLCCMECGCIDFPSFEPFFFFPIVFTNEETEGKGKNKKTYNKVNLINLTEHHRDADKPIEARGEIIDFMCSDYFHNYVGARRKIIGASDASQVVIMAKDTTWTATPHINALIATGRPFSLVTGEGDPIVPPKVVKDQLEKYVPIYSRMKAEGPQEWTSEPNDRWLSKNFENFEWRKLTKCGHLPFVDDPAMFTEHMTHFVDENEPNSVSNVSHPKVVSHVIEREPVEVHSHVERPYQHHTHGYQNTSHVVRPSHNNHSSHVVSSHHPTSQVVSRPSHQQSHPVSYQPYRMSHSQTGGHGNRTVTNNSYNPYGNPTQKHH